MARKRQSPYDRLPPFEKELLDEWNAIVGCIKTNGDGDDSVVRLMALYDRCRNDSGWCVSAYTASTIAGSLLSRAMGNRDFEFAISTWDTFLAHPQAHKIDSVTRIDRTCFYALAKFMAGDVDAAVKLWTGIVQGPQLGRAVLRHALPGLCQWESLRDAEAQIDPRLRPLLGKLRCRSKRIKKIAEGTDRATYAEMAELLEAVRAREWTKRQAKLGKPNKDAS